MLRDWMAGPVEHPAWLASGLGDGSIDNGNRRKLLLHQEIALILRDNLTCYTFDGHDALMRAEITRLQSFLASNTPCRPSALQW